MKRSTRLGTALASLALTSGLAVAVAPAANAAAPASTSLTAVPQWSWDDSCSTFQWMIAPHPCFVVWMMQ